MTSSSNTFFTSEEDSRDSGVCDMEIEESATSFTVMEVNSFPNIEKMTDEEEEQALYTNLMNETQESYPSFVAPNKIFDDSPKSTSPFVRPLLAFRSNDRLISRKRTAVQTTKTNKIKISKDFEMEQPSTSSSESIDVQKTQSSSVLERRSKVDIELAETYYHLETIAKICSNAFRRITAQTMKTILSSGLFDKKYILIDCRYSYEFNGGHVKHAINIYDPADLESVFYDEKRHKKENRIPIFYCEYSQKRGPSMAHALRRLDRVKNELAYPHCDYPEIYVLDKGYRNFYYSSRNSCTETYCEPDNYIEMDDKQFSEQLKQWNFHKKSSIGASVRVVDSKTRSLFRHSVSSTSFSPSSSRRSLFSSLSSPSGLSTLVGTRTPSRLPTRPLTNPKFS